jgi:UDP-N-acetylmuramate: L-alanyl-gamma-D-glutamyl-meso-diaminopimelate ligase
VFQREIAAALASADLVVLGPVHRADQLDEAERFSPEEAVSDVERAGGRACSLSDYPSVTARVLSEARSGDVVVALSNGPFGGVVAELREKLGTS